jgi:hypothetical protein
MTAQGSQSRDISNRWRGKWALVTGASAGIGWAIAEKLAAGGCNLVLTARRRGHLEKFAAEEAARHGVHAEIVIADLVKPGAPREIFEFTSAKKIPVEFLVNNAGFGAYGHFSRMDLQRQLEMVQVNCAAVVHLTGLYVQQMVERRSGDILIVASTAAFQAVPYVATYAATKGFDLLYGEALAEELAPHGVHVCVLCPGPTDSEFADIAGTPPGPGKRFETAEKVARVGLEALANGKSSVISGFLNNLQMQLERIAPRRLVTGAAGRLYRPKDDR